MSCAREREIMRGETHKGKGGGDSNRCVHGARGGGGRLGRRAGWATEPAQEGERGESRGWAARLAGPQGEGEGREGKRVFSLF
jgi:hypothetical protein